MEQYWSPENERRSGEWCLNRLRAYLFYINHFAEDRVQHVRPRGCTGGVRGNELARRKGIRGGELESLRQREPVWVQLA
jgi:hypothetical protein